MKDVFITGVSTGIGHACAQLLLERGFRVYGSVRTRADADELQKLWGTSFTSFVMDVCDETSVRGAANEMKNILNGKTLFALVNNAGIALGGPFLQQPFSDIRQQFETNLIGAASVTQEFAPLLIANPRGFSKYSGRIINISSVVGSVAVPFLSAYSASKHGLEGFSCALRREMQFYGVDVIIIAPGSVLTPIWDKAEQKDAAFLEGSALEASAKKFRKYMLQQGQRGISPQKVALTILNALLDRKPRWRYPVVRHFFKDWVLLHMLPERVLDRLFRPLFRQES